MPILPKPIYQRYSVISLLFANIIPVLGVLFGDWKVFDIVVFYWVETFVIGLSNVVKMIFAQGSFGAKDVEVEKQEIPIGI